MLRNHPFQIVSGENGFKCGSHLEWCTNVPLGGFIDKSLESPVFSVMGCEFSLKFTAGGFGKFSFLALYLKCIHKNTSQDQGFVFINYQVGTITTPSLFLGEGRLRLPAANGHRLWSINKEFLKSKMSLDYIPYGTHFKFILSFVKDTGLQLMITRNKTEDKCVQTSSYLNASSPVESILDDFSKLLDAGTNHDAEIKCGEHSIKVHKIILSARSDVFKSMFENNFKEGQSGIVEIQDMDINYVKDFIRYLYTGEISELTFEKAKTLYEVGDKYNIRSLMLRCYDYLQENLTEENAFQCLGLADMHSDENFKQIIQTFIYEKKLYLQDELWEPFCENYPKLAEKDLKEKTVNVETDELITP